MSTLLTPSGAINDQRTQIHLLLSQRLLELNLTQLLVRTVTSAPPSVLPYLLWELDVWDIASALEYFGLSQTTIIQNAVYLHQLAGTPQAIIYALGLCGFPNATILEGANSWGGGGYPASQAWAVFRVAVTAALTATQITNLTTIINFLKAARCHLDSIVHLGTNFSDAEIIAPVSGSVYSVTNTPDPINGMLLYVNGLFYTDGVDYSVVGNRITFLHALPSSPLFRAFYAFNTPPANVFYTYVTGSFTGVNKTFTIPTPSPTNATELYFNGALLKFGLDYTMSGGTITLASTTPAPRSGDVLYARYMNGTDPTLGTISFQYNETPTNVVGNTYSLLYAPAPAQSLRFFRNGICLTQGFDYTISGNTITMLLALQPTDVLLCYYRYTS
jgi:P2-related tail formation protein